MLLVTHWVKTGYRKETRAQVYAERIVAESGKSVTFLLTDGTKLTVKRDNIISIEIEGE